MGVTIMNDFIEQYAWSATSIVGGMTGLSMLFNHLFDSHSSFSLVLQSVLDGLM